MRALEAPVGELWTAMTSPSPEVRAAAAIGLGECWKNNDPKLPSGPELMAELARRDAENPGIADAFWATIYYELRCDGDFDSVSAKPWILQILSARRARLRPLSPVPGNDLEFYAHEMFDSDFAALATLLSWGYVHVVELALDHRALEREHSVTLLNALYAQYARAEHGEWLAVEYGVVHPSAAARWPALNLGASSLWRVLTRSYGYYRQWTAHWLFPEHPGSALAIADPACIVPLLLDAGLPITEDEAAIDSSKIGHIPFPELPTTARRTLLPRRDLVLDLAVDDRTQGIAALRLVRARRVPDARSQ